MADAAISMLVEPLISRIEQWLEKEISLVKGVKEELKKLPFKLHTIQNVLDDAETRSVKEKTVQGWLDNLKEILYEMDDVLDEWNTAISKPKIEEAENPPVCKEKISCSSLFSCSSCNQDPCFPFKQLGLRHDIAWKIKDINMRLDSIIKEIKDFKFFLISLPSRSVNFVESERITSSIIEESQVYGRDFDKETFLRKLLSEDSHKRNRIPIISIVGASGVGKTTLAKLVYNSDEVGERFNTKIWVCVSTPFDVYRIANEIVEAVKGNPINVRSKNFLLGCLKDSISVKHFLLVLDDVWNEDEKKWEELRNCLEVGAAGSRIIVTTRKDKVAKVMGTSSFHQLDLLSESASWSLFSETAFAEKEDEKEEREMLTNIGKEIVQKCKGLPLAIRTIGSLLRFKSTVEEWQHILDSEIWQLEEVEVELFPHLYLSYNELPPALKRCFSYCSIFPKDSRIDVDLLIRFWMAQGFVTSNDKHDMELKGREYFDKLATCSFFQNFMQDEKKIVSCKMHDIVHDFARYLARTECITIEKGKLDSLSRKARHLHTENENPLTVCDMGKLRTFIAIGFPLKQPVDLFNRLNCVRLLSLVNCGLKSLSEEIRNLIHLRYLNLSGNTLLNQLPESVCELYNLQTLNIEGCKGIQVLPQTIGKLINLRHLYIDSHSLQECPVSFAKLTNLRTLRYLIKVGRKFCKLEYLQHFNHLRGKLEITFAFDVEEADILADAEKLELKSKKYIKELSLQFEGFEALTDAVLEALQPPPTIEKLVIAYISCAQYPNWLTQSLDNLRVLTIIEWGDVSILPPLGKLHFLEKLKIEKLRKVKHVGCEFLGIKDTVDIVQGHSTLKRALASVYSFPKLLELTFEELPAWEAWEDLNHQEEEDASVQIMPQLRRLTLKNCPELYQLPDRLLRKMSSLQCLEIEKCGLSETMVERSDHIGQLVTRIPLIHVDYMEHTLHSTANRIQIRDVQDACCIM